MSNLVISVQNLSKIYRLGKISSGTLTYDLKIWWAKLRGKPNPILKIGKEDYENRIGEEIWALKDVNFTVNQGEVLGIIGKNGAGKSTLLKILSEVTAPSNGEIKIKGRIASLLEVGTGFHPDLTGRENVFLNGAILGMTRQEIRNKFDEIVDFSEVGQFIDTPVKRYSSGMHVRLAFAVAAHLDPEIMIVDEVLAVGDARFQRKCLGKMGSVASEGRTVLFVSHNMAAMQSLCDRALWLNSGELKGDGNVGDIISDYLRSGLQENNLNEKIWTEQTSAPGNDTVRLNRISVQPETGKPGDIIDTQTPIEIIIDYWNLLPDVHLHAALQFYNEQGILVFTTGAISDHNTEMHDHPPRGLMRSICHVPGRFLNSGFYRVNLVMVRHIPEISYRTKEIIRFQIINDPDRSKSWYGKEDGVLSPRLPWETILLDRNVKNQNF